MQSSLVNAVSPTDNYLVISVAVAVRCWVLGGISCGYHRQFLSNTNIGSNQTDNLGVSLPGWVIFMTETDDISTDFSPKFHSQSHSYFPSNI